MDHPVIVLPNTDSEPMDLAVGVGGQSTGADAEDVDFGMEVDGLVKEVDEECDGVIVTGKEGKTGRSTGGDEMLLVGDESDGGRSKGAVTVDLDLRVDGALKQTDDVGNIVLTVEQDGTGKNMSEEELDPLFGEGSSRFTGIDTVNPYLGIEVDGVFKEPNEEENGVKGLKKVGKNKKKKLEKRIEREDDDEGNTGRRKKKNKSIDGKLNESARNMRKLEKVCFHSHSFSMLNFVQMNAAFSYKKLMNACGDRKKQYM